MKVSNKLFFLKQLFSPFRPFRLKFYFGRIAVGVPYFYPRRVVNNKFKPRKLGFDFCGLGWKTKWSPDDFRFEYAPILSFVLWKWQAAIIVRSDSELWEAWLYYELITDKKKRTSDRVADCITGFPQKFVVTGDGESKKIDYYEINLKKKWRPISLQQLREEKLETLLK